MRRFVFALLIAACSEPAAPSEDAGLVRDGGGRDAGADAGRSDPDAGTSDAGGCADECASEGALECSEGAVRACTRSAGCLRLGAATPCASGSCASTTSCADCDAVCTPGASECTDSSLRSCALGADGCPAWSTFSACESGVCADAASCCPPPCDTNAVTCESGAVRACQTDANGCRVWSDPTPCPSGACAGSICAADFEIMTVSFGEQRRYASGDQPSWVGVGHFDGDVHLDVVSVNVEPDSVSLFSGVGDGTLRSAQTITLGHTVRNGTLVRALVGDIERDGRSDLIVSFRNEDEIVIFRGAAFSTPVTLQAYGPEGLALADVDGDTRLDLIYGTQDVGRNGIYIARGRGDGTFDTAVALAAGTGVDGVLATDHDGDSDADLTVLGYPLLSLRNGGAGDFTEHWRASSGGTHDGLAVADFDGDAIDDLLLAFSGTNSKTLWLGVGDGTFTPPVRTLYLGSGRALATGDFDRDGDTDLIVDACCNEIGVALSYGDGTFVTDHFHVSCGGPEAFAAGDLDEDGLLDIITANYLCDDVGVLLNTSE
jgi:hypothetical protein